MSIPVNRKDLFQLPFIILFFFNFCSGFVTVSAQKIKAGLYTDRVIHSIVFSIVEGSYQVKGDGNVLMTVHPGEIFYLSAGNNAIQFSSGIRKYGEYTQLEIDGTTETNVFQLKPVSPILPSSDYDGNLFVSLVHNKLQIVNQVETDSYISGVIEAEGGSNALPEYYKAQAILIRTYAIKNMFRHAAEGYNLCSSEHCQAYKGRSMLNRQIYEATHATDKLVLTDKSNNIIVAPYHSNCGGITSTADMAWQSGLKCLYAVNDPFCASGKNYSWSKHIQVTRWNSYLERHGLNTGSLPPLNYGMRSSNRQKYLKIKNISIPMRKIREDFGLKSTFFNIEKTGNEIIFRGKGFGHGVGLCQEGAMEMAKAGYTYVDILHFYYQYVKIVSLDSIESEPVSTE